MKTFRTEVRDSEGFSLIYSATGETKKDSVALAKRLSKEPRAYWVQHAESETFPDEIHSICVIRESDESVQVELFPSFK